MNLWGLGLLPLGAVAVLLSPKRHRRSVLFLACLAVLPLCPSLCHSESIPGTAHPFTLAPWAMEQGEIGWPNRNLDDIPRQIYPWMLFVRTELRAGRWPYWNPYQGGGMPMNGQAAPASPWTLLFTLLPLELGFLALPWSRALIAGCGTYALALELGLSKREALLSASVYELCGVVSCTLLYPLGSALVLVPWVFYAAQKRSVCMLASALALQLVSGHPHTGAQTCLLLSLYVFLSRGWNGGKESLLACTSLGCMLGVGLAAFVWVPNWLEFTQSLRWSQAGVGTTPEPHFFPLSLLFFPDLFGNPIWGNFTGPYNYLASSIYLGVIPLLLAIIGALKSREARPWLILGIVSLGLALSWPILADIYQLIPGLRRASVHRIKFGFELGVSLMAGLGLRGLRNSSARSLSVLAIGYVILQSAIVVWSKQAGVQVPIDWLVLNTFLLVGVTATGTRFSKNSYEPILCITVLQLSLVAVPFNGYMPVHTLTSEIDLPGNGLQRLSGRSSLPPNLAIIQRIRDLRVNDSAQPREHAEKLRTIDDEDFLDSMGVSFLMRRDGSIETRPSALSLVRWSDGTNDGLTVSSAFPGYWKIHWRSSQSRTLEIAEFFYHGWSASEGLQLVRSSSGLLEVRVSPGEGDLEVVYRPVGLTVGRVVSLISLGWIILIVVWKRREEKS